MKVREAIVVVSGVTLAADVERQVSVEPGASSAGPSLLPRVTMLRLPQVKVRTGLGRATIYAQQAEGLFPPNVSLGARAVGWIESEVDAVIDARVRGAEPAVIRELVVRLVAARHREQRDLPDLLQRILQKQ